MNPTSAMETKAEQFIQSVLALQPLVAVFDCDGTLWSGDAGEDFLWWELEHNLLPPSVAGWIRPRYADYKAGKVDELSICGEMVTIHEGLAAGLLERAAAEFFEERVTARIFPELRDLTFRLAESGCDLWAVSSTNDWIIRAAMKHFAIPSDRVLAACVHIEEGVASGRLRQVPTDELKAVAIRDNLSVPVDVAFGNSIHDADMLAMARYAFAVNPNPALERLAAERRWRIYKPDSGR